MRTFITCVESSTRCLDRKTLLAQISFRKTSNLTAEFLPTNSDYLLWYGKDIEQLKFHQLFVEKTFENGSTIVSAVPSFLTALGDD